eukprot:g60379.t1
MVLFIAGDIGGTNARLRLIEERGGVTTIKATTKYPSKEFPSLTHILAFFLKEQKISKEDWPQFCCLAVAGPVLNNECSFTNIGAWPKLVGDKMGAELGIRHFRFVNDFVGIGYGILALERKDYTVLNVGKPEPKAIISCIGAGTGLGQCLLTWNGKEYDTHSTEGGHTEFAPQNEEQWRLRQYIAHELGISHVSAERVVSGTGIPYIYYFLCHEHPEKAHTPMERQLQADMEQNPSAKGYLVSKAAKENRYGLAARAIRLFIDCYGAEAGNLALKTLSFGGVYLAGGVAPENMWAILENERFMKAFLAKGRMKYNSVMPRCPVYVIHGDVDVGILGAQVVCKRMIRDAFAQEEFAPGGQAAKL